MISLPSPHPIYPISTPQSPQRRASHFPQRSFFLDSIYSLRVFGHCYGSLRLHKKPPFIPKRRSRNCKVNVVYVWSTSKRTVNYNCRLSRSLQEILKHGLLDILRHDWCNGKSLYSSHLPRTPGRHWCVFNISVHLAVSSSVASRPCLQGLRVRIRWELRDFGPNFPSIKPFNSHSRLR